MDPAAGPEFGHTPINDVHINGDISNKETTACTDLDTAAAIGGLNTTTGNKYIYTPHRQTSRQFDHANRA
jgi:hypothetical protein